MEIIKTPLEGLLVIKPRIFGDDRGCFFESWSKVSFSKVGLDLDFVQDNQSLSTKGVLRGLHFQNPPYAQGILVRVIKGVDIGSPWEEISLLLFMFSFLARIKCQNILLYYFTILHFI